MTVKRRKKSTRQVRQSGWGHKKKHRGAGSRGGVGRAGIHKHHFVYAITKGLFDKGRLAESGFKRHASLQEKSVSINVSQLEESIPKLLEAKLAEKSGSLTLIDCEKIGVQKVLGGGRLTTPLHVKARSFSESAKAKIEKVGGKAEQC